MPYALCPMPYALCPMPYPHEYLISKLEKLYYLPPTTTFLIRKWGPPTLTAKPLWPPFPQPP